MQPAKGHKGNKCMDCGDSCLDIYSQIKEHNEKIAN